MRCFLENDRFDWGFGYDDPDRQPDAAAQRDRVRELQWAICKVSLRVLVGVSALSAPTVPPRSFAANSRFNKFCIE